MALRKKSFKAILLTILLGIAVGTVIGGVLQQVLPEGIVRTVLTESLEYSVNMEKVDLLVLSFGFSFGIKINFISVLMIFVMIQLLKWSW